MNQKESSVISFHSRSEAFLALDFEKELASIMLRDCLLGSSGAVHAIYGPMASGKSTVAAMVKDTLEYAGRQIQCFKPRIVIGGLTVSEDPCSYPRGRAPIIGKLIESSADLYRVPRGGIVFIDEAQFLSAEIVNAITKVDWQRRGVNIACFGLDKWHHGGTWNEMQAIIDIAETSGSTYQLHALCDHDGCLNSAEYTQQLVDGTPNPHGPNVAIRTGAEVSNIPTVEYAPRCVVHHVGLDQSVIEVSP